MSFAEKLSKDLILRCQLAERKREEFSFLSSADVAGAHCSPRQPTGGVASSCPHCEVCFFGLAVSQFVKSKTKFFKPKKKIKRGCTSLEHMLNLQFRPDLLPSERVGERE